jgi:hypothetical protein
MFDLVQRLIERFFLFIQMSGHLLRVIALHSVLWDGTPNFIFTT